MAQRARAKAKAETEHLRSEVTILAAQLDILKNALSRSVSSTLLATILANCEEQRTIHATHNNDETQDDEDDGETVSRSSSSPRVNTNTARPILISHPTVPPSATNKYQTIPLPSFKQSEPVMVTSSDIHHQQHPLTAQQLQQLQHMHMLQQMVELQQQLAHASQPQPQPPSTLYQNNFGQFPFISYNLAAAAAAAAAASQANSKSSLSLLQLPLPSQSMCSSNGSERSYSSTSSSHSSSSMATDITSTTDHEDSSTIDHDTVAPANYQNQRHRGSSNMESDSPRSVEDDAEMVFTALTHMRSEILKNSTKDH